MKIVDNSFTENYSSLKGTAIYIKQYSSIMIDNTLFFQNGPVYAGLESKYSPYSKYLIGFKSYTYRDPKCSDEIMFLQDCDDSETDYLLLPRVRGAIFIEHCQADFCLNFKDTFIQELTVKNSVFKQNDAGPGLDYTFIDSQIYPSASQIFIEGGINNVLSNCQFVKGRS